MNKRFLLTLFYLFSLMLLAESCSKDNDPVPVNTTTGSGTNSRFSGDWNISENSKEYGPATYSLKIIDSTNASYILFQYLYGYHTKIKATVSGNSISIASQIVEGNSVYGSGSLVTTSKITLSYYVSDGLTKDTVTAVLTK